MKVTAPHFKALRDGAPLPTKPGHVKMTIVGKPGRGKNAVRLRCDGGERRGERRGDEKREEGESEEGERRGGEEKG